MRGTVAYALGFMRPPDYTGGCRRGALDKVHRICHEACFGRFHIRGVLCSLVPSICAPSDAHKVGALSGAI